MEISVKGLMMGASVVITVALITLGLFQYGRARQLSGLVSDEMGTLAGEIAENEILRYDGARVSGSDIRNFARKVFSDGTKDGIVITVKGEAGNCSYSSYRDTDAMLDPDSSGYISPTGRYIGKVNRNGNGIITGITFTVY